MLPMAWPMVEEVRWTLSALLDDPCPIGPVDEWGDMRDPAQQATADMTPTELRLYWLDECPPLSPAQERKRRYTTAS